MPRATLGLSALLVALFCAGSGAAQAAPDTFDLVKAVGRVLQGETLEITIMRAGRSHTLRMVPDGEATLWIDPEYWEEWVNKGLRKGSRGLRRKLEELERRLEELERIIEEDQDGAQRT